MPGGLIQIATYGSQDLFLTGTPEITFFKVVYRRYTNFSMESIRINFDDPTGFGKNSSCIIPSIGDLMHKVYLEVILPEIDFKRLIPQDTTDLEIAYNTSKANYKIVTDFMDINKRAFLSAYEIYIAENSDDTENMIQEVQRIFNEPGASTKINDFKELLTLTTNVPFTYSEVSMDEIVRTFDASDKKEQLFAAMEIGIVKSIRTQNYFFIDLRTKSNELSESKNNNVKFAWVEKIGHAIFESVEVRIGGSRIDKHYSDWINIWYELSGKKDMDKIYNNLIGNIDILTEFNREKKPKYILKIPLQFWFCRFSGLSLPLVALEYHDVSLHVKFRNIEDVSYIEPNVEIKYINDDGLMLDEVPSETGLDISANLLIDYIYLDSPERRRFAQSSHEYLIEQLQILEKENVTEPKIRCVIRNFVHPSKELIWIAQRAKYTININGNTKLQWYNYSINDNGTGNPIAYSSIDFHSYNRVLKLDYHYFNYVQPYESHQRTPSDGINMYAFSIFPEEHQPSGTANLSRLSHIALNLEFDKSLFPDNQIPDVLNVRIYTRNLNILRFISGLSGLAYVYG